MKEKAKPYIEIILKNEGGFQKNPKDYGNWSRFHQQDCPYPLRYRSDICRNCKKCLIGTQRGIAARWFAQYYDIPKMTLRECENAFYFWFWKPQNCEFILHESNQEFILQLFDYGVNTSVYFANKTFQKIIGAFPDGIIGNETKNKLYEYEKSGGDILEDYKHARRVYYEYSAQKGDNKEFLGDWLKRVDDTSKYYYKYFKN